MLLIIILFLISTSSQSDLFAGNGLKTYTQNILNNKIIEIDCSTYDDCYELLCSYMYQPIFLITIKPNYWNKNCDELNKTDNRLLSAEIDSYINNKYVGYNLTNTVSDNSIALCMLNKNKTINQLQYFIYNCTIT
jgi:hypothetical protein